MAHFCENTNKISGLIKRGEFFEGARNYQILKQFIGILLSSLLYAAS